MADGSDDEDEPVGYKKPPKKHQFKKGHSGNRKGPKPKSQQMTTLLDKELNKKITMKENGVSIVVTKREAIVKRKVNAALGGSERAIDYLIKFSIQHGAPDPFIITDEDREAMKAALERAREDEEAQKPKGGDEAPGDASSDGKGDVTDDPPGEDAQ